MRYSSFYIFFSILVLKNIAPVNNSAKTIAVLCQDDSFSQKLCFGNLFFFWYFNFIKEQYLDLLNKYKNSQYKNEPTILNEN